MRGTDETSRSLFSYVDLEDRIPARHPLRKIRQVVNDALASLDAEFEALYTDFGRPSIPPERLIRASLLQILFSVRSERQLMEQMWVGGLRRLGRGTCVSESMTLSSAIRQKKLCPGRYTRVHARLFTCDNAGPSIISSTRLSTWTKCWSGRAGGMSCR